MRISPIILFSVDFIIYAIFDDDQSQDLSARAQAQQLLFQLSTSKISFSLITFNYIYAKNMFSSILDIVSCPNSYADVPDHYALLIFLKYQQTLKSQRNPHLTKIKSFFHSTLIESTFQLQKQQRKLTFCKWE